MIDGKTAAVVIVDGEFTSGLNVYGLGRPGLASPRYETEWLGGAKSSDWRLFGDAWEVIAATIPITSWPSGDPWTDGVHATLNAWIEVGSRVAWLGRNSSSVIRRPSSSLTV